MKKRKLYMGYVRRFAPFATGAVLGLGALVWRLGSLAPRLAPGEQQTLAVSQHLSLVAADPMHLPLKFLLWAVQRLPGGTPLWLARMPDVVIALTALSLFVYILHHWYGRRSVLFGFALLLASTWFLHVGRHVGFDAEYLLAMISLLAVNIMVHDEEEGATVWFAWLAANILLLFIPGLVWFVLLSAIWQWRALVNLWGQLSTLQRVISAAVATLSFAGLTYALIRNFGLVFVWLGVPHTLSALRQIPGELTRTGLALVYQGPHQPELWLGTLPLLDVFIILMFLTGAYFYARHWQATRTHLLGGYLVLGFVLISVGDLSYSLIVPILYLVAVAGIAYALQFWLRTFPRNPLARALGIGLVAAVVTLSCSYNLFAYFIAWPHNPETTAVYQQK